ncbi:MAG: Ig-like domain-containing protein [Gemmatimonadota bacterium]
MHRLNARVLFLLCIAGCAGNDGPVGITVVTAVQVTLQDSTVYAGQYLRASAAPVDREGLPLIADTTLWSSSNPAIATVSPKGVVSGIAPGTVDIIATAAGFSGKAKLTVIAAGAAQQWLSLSAAVAATCGVATTGIAYCWGSPDFGLFNTSPARRGIPTPVASALRFAQLVSGQHDACGLTVAGAAWCWGISDQHAQLGRGPATGVPDTVPAPVSGGLVFKQLSAGSSAFTCGLTNAGAAWCWGNGFGGELGNGSTSDSDVPVPVSGGLLFSSITAGSGFACGLTIAGAAWCWGANNRGQGGRGSTTATNVPAPVSGELTFIALSAGYDFACGISTSGAAYCWGNNVYGELGNGALFNGPTTVPTLVAGGVSFASISAGGSHACAITASGAGYCWGSAAGVGALGIGRNADSSVPVAVAGGLSFRSITPGTYHICGVTVAGAAYCWGNNSFWSELGVGQLFPDSNVPVAVFSSP